jgi:hypothetical protein
MSGKFLVIRLSSARDFRWRNRKNDAVLFQRGRNWFTFCHFVPEGASRSPMIVNWREDISCEGYAQSLGQQSLLEANELTWLSCNLTDNVTQRSSKLLEADERGLERAG